MIVREDTPGDKRLAAYLVLAQPPAQDDPGAIPAELIDDLRKFLRQSLPEYMLPSAFVFLEALPISQSGKVDRRALERLASPQDLRQQVRSVYQAPSTLVELTLARICAGLLNIAWVGEASPVGIHDNFFELGGHSLLATQFASRVREEFKVELPLRVLFEHPTIAELALEVEQLQQAGVRPQAPAITAVSRADRRVKRTALDSAGDVSRPEDGQGNPA